MHFEGHFLCEGRRIIIIRIESKTRIAIVSRFTLTSLTPPKSLRFLEPMRVHQTSINQESLSCFLLTPATFHSKAPGSKSLSVAEHQWFFFVSLINIYDSLKCRRFRRSRPLRAQPRFDSKKASRKGDAWGDGRIHHTRRPFMRFAFFAPSQSGFVFGREKSSAEDLFSVKYLSEWQWHRKMERRHTFAPNIVIEGGRREGGKILRYSRRPCSIDDKA